MDFDEIRTRVAPSPTGFLHFGVARTALFNYLFAKQHNGKFILRIEDTDPERSQEEYEVDITDGLSWLGLSWDEGPLVEGRYGPYHQSKKTAIYKKHADELVAGGLAYQKDEAIYFKVPEKVEIDDTKVEFDDLIKGKVSFELKDVPDFVILKSDGTPTFHFAVVIDDFDMKISHVIRGEDHLSNTPKHILLQKALNIPTPVYGHLPMIVNADRTKMSKRKDPVSITKDFKSKGYLPEAMINFMVLLGWAPTGEKEFFSMDDLIADFDIARVGKSPSIFNQQKLDWLNGNYIRKLEIGELAKMLQPFYAKYKIDVTGEYLIKVASLVQERLKNLDEAYSLTSFMFGDSIEISKELLISKTKDPVKTKQILEKAINLFETEDFDTDVIEAKLRDFVNDENLVTKEVFQTIRVAVCGTDVSPPLFLTIGVLGKDRTVLRLKDALKVI